MSTNEIDISNDNHDERLAAEILRLRLELEQTLQQSQQLLEVEPDEQQQEISQQSIVSPRVNLIRKASQIDFIDTADCFKFVSHDDDHSGDGMLSYEEITVGTNDFNDFIGMVDDDVTAIEEEILSNTNLSESVHHQQQRPCMGSEKRTPSLRDHLLSHSQHRSPKKETPYVAYTSKEDTERSDDKLYQETNDINEEIVHDDNQSYVSYDEITVTTADLLAEMDATYQTSNTSLQNSLTNNNITVNISRKNDNVDSGEINNVSSSSAISFLQPTENVLVTATETTPQADSTPDDNDSIVVSSVDTNAAIINTSAETTPVTDATSEDNDSTAAPSIDTNAAIVMENVTQHDHNSVANNNAHDIDSEKNPRIAMIETMFHDECNLEIDTFSGTDVNMSQENAFATAIPNSIHNKEKELVPRTNATTTDHVKDVKDNVTSKVENGKEEHKIVDHLSTGSTTEWIDFNQVTVGNNYNQLYDNYKVDNHENTHRNVDMNLKPAASPINQNVPGAMTTSMSTATDLSIDEQIRLMQDEMSKSSPIRFNSPLRLTKTNTTGSSMSPHPISISLQTITAPSNSSTNPKPIQSSVTDRSATQAKPYPAATPDKSKSPLKSENQKKLKQQSPKSKIQPSMKIHNDIVQQSILPSSVQSESSPKRGNIMLSPKTSVQSPSNPTKTSMARKTRSPKTPQSAKSKENSPKRLSVKSPTGKVVSSPQTRIAAIPPIHLSPSLVKTKPKSELLNETKTQNDHPNQNIVPPQSPVIKKNDATPCEFQIAACQDVLGDSNKDWEQFPAINVSSPQSETIASTECIEPSTTDQSVDNKKKKKKTVRVRKIRKKTPGSDEEIGPSDGKVDQAALDLQAQIDEMEKQIAALTAATLIATNPQSSKSLPKQDGLAKVDAPVRPPPLFNLLGDIESAATKRVQRLEETGGELKMQEVVPEVDVKPSNNRQLSTSMAEMISQRAAARDKRLADGGEKRMRKVTIKEKDEYKKDFSSIVGDVAAMGRLTRLNEYTVEAVAQPKKVQEEWKSNGLLAIQWRSAHMSVIHDAAAAGNATKMPEYTVSNFPDENNHDSKSTDSGRSKRMEQLLRLDTKVGEGLRKVDNFVLGQKEHQGKLNSLLIKPMQSYSKIEDVKLPRDTAPKIDPVKNAEKLSRMKREALLSGRPMVDISASAAERAWERRARLDRPGTAPKVQEVCPCPYCVSASPYQTFAYRELERRRKEEGHQQNRTKDHTKTKQNNCIHIDHIDTKSTDTDAAQIITNTNVDHEDIDEIELKRRERQRIREERRKLKQAVAEAEAALAKAAVNVEKDNSKPNDTTIDVDTRPECSLNTTIPKSSTLVSNRIDEWNNTTSSTKPINSKYKNKPPSMDQVGCKCTIM